MQKRHQLQLQTGQNLTLAGDQKLCQGTSADGDQVNLAYCQLTNHAAPQFHVAATPKHAVLAPYPPPTHTPHLHTWAHLHTPATTLCSRSAALWWPAHATAIRAQHTCKCSTHLQ
jgi:hypothetical protein